MIEGEKYTQFCPTIQAMCKYDCASTIAHCTLHTAHLFCFSIGVFEQIVNSCIVCLTSAQGQLDRVGPLRDGQEFLSESSDSVSEVCPMAKRWLDRCQAGESSVHFELPLSVDNS